jgi:DNA-binding NarL/FixJ family response regulator
MTPPLRVLLADDHPVFRKGLRALLTSLPEASVVGEAADGEQAVRVAVEQEPDVVVMDLNIPGVNGVEAAPLSLRRVLDISPHAVSTARTGRHSCTVMTDRRIGHVLDLLAGAYPQA